MISTECTRILSEVSSHFWGAISQWITIQGVRLFEFATIHLVFMQFIMFHHPTLTNPRKKPREKAGTGKVNGTSAKQNAERTLSTTQWRTGDTIWLITYISYLFNPFGATITKPPPFLQPFYRSRMPSKLCPKGQGDGGFNTLLACPNFTTIHAVLHTYAVLPSDSGGRSTEPTSF